LSIKKKRDGERNARNAVFSEAPEKAHSKPETKLQIIPSI
jgi:hypothetical protein